MRDNHGTTQTGIRSSMTPALRDRFLENCREAIRGENVGHDLWRIALRMRLEGISQEEAYEIIAFAREAVTGDDPKDEEICDVLDGVVGWCSPSYHIWSPKFDAKKALNEYEGNNQATAIDQTDPPNGGPASPSGNSEADGGPRSVS